MLAGKRLFPGVMQVNVLSFTAALLLGTVSILSLGFLIASLVPTARFAQPITAVLLYPMVALSGLFFPVERLPRRCRSLAYRASDDPRRRAHARDLGRIGWGAHWLNAAALVLLFAAFSGLSTRVFRWE